MRHFFSRRVRAVLLASLVIALVLAVTGSLLGKNIPGMLVQSVLTPLRMGAKAVTTQAQQIYDYIYRYEKLEAENAQLRELLAQLQEDGRIADALQRENERYRQLLQLLEENEDYKVVDGFVISRSSSDWSSTITINRGSSAGIQEGMCAISASGQVVGLVTEVGSNYAVIKTILDSSMKISGTISATGYSGIVTGGYASGRGDLLKMDFLPTDSVIRNNDQVVTSGSTVYPRGLILGHVVDAGFGDTGVAKYAMLQPAADIDNLEQVFILTEFAQS